MTTEPSPTVRKLRLGIELRRLRLRAGRTMPDAADHVARTDSTISRLETGQVAVSRSVLEKLLDLYAATPGERDTLRTLARDARQRGWWHEYAESLPPGFDVYVGLETEATHLWCYRPEAVPGLLRTEAYTRALLKAADPEAAKDTVDDRVTVGLRRRRRLGRNDDAPHLWAILHESVLHHHVGGREVMREQLAHLHARAREPGVALQILPYAAGAHPAMQSGGFTLLSVPLGGEQSHDVAYVEHLTGGLCLDRPTEVIEYRKAFARLRDAALGTDESRSLIARLTGGPTP